MISVVDGEVVSYDEHGVFELAWHDLGGLTNGTLHLVAGAAVNGVCSTNGVCGLPIVQADVYCHSGGAGVWAGSDNIVCLGNVACNP